MKARLIPTKDLVNVPDWNEKARKIAEQARNKKIGCIWGLLPSVLDYIEKAKEFYSKEEFKYFSRWIEVLFLSGVNYRSYRERIYEALGRRVDIMEYYAACEGIIGHQSLSRSDAMEFYADQNFLEFIPFDQYQIGDYSTRKLVHELSEGEDYAVCVTTGNGAFSYIIGDVIQCVDPENCIFRIKGRTVLTLNMAGEKTSISVVEKTVNRISREYSVNPGEYFVTGKTGTSNRPYYLWVFENNDSWKGKDMDQLARKIDKYLLEHNNLYQLLYDTNFDPCRIKFIGRDKINNWFMQKNADLGHTKLPRIICDPKIARELTA